VLPYLYMGSITGDGACLFNSDCSATAASSWVVRVVPMALCPRLAAPTGFQSTGHLG